MWQTAVLIVWSANPTGLCCGPPGCQHPAASVGAAVWTADSRNFRVVSYAATYGAPSIAECCEAWRKDLQTKWLGGASDEAWNPKCHIVIHASRQTYRAAIGRGGEQTFGSSIVDFTAGRFSQRRIDLLIDTQGTISALGHELTHVVIADAFPGTQVPPWAGEGAAVLADSTAKQQRHRRDLDHSLARRTAFHCAELLPMSQYPPPHRIAAFYGQSASLTEFLAGLSGPGKIIPFLQQAGYSGYDAALRDCYGIPNLAELDSRWRKHLSTAIRETAPATTANSATAYGD